MQTTVATIEQPTRQALAVVDRSAPRRVTGKLLKAIDAMVWTGARRDEAAKAAGLTDHGLRAALKKPHVKAHYLAECEVLRTSGRARRIHRLEAMVEQDENKQAVINACRALDHQEESQQAAGLRSAVPGFVIIVQAPAPHALEPYARDKAKPLITHETVSHHDAAERGQDVDTSET